jgi:membrane protease YdiL (CAAX protease family)
MIMAGVGTFVAGRYVFKDGFEDAGWRWGRPRHYVLAIGLALFLWLVPVVIENVSGLRSDPWEPGWTSMLVSFITAFAITLLPAFGEEFSWRGYLIPRLLERFTTRQALLLHGFVTWLWHVPFIVTMGFQLGGVPAVSVPVVLAVSLVPTVLHGWPWSTGSRLRRSRSTGCIRRSYTINRDGAESVGAKALNTNGFELDTRIVTGVCDNQFAATRNLLILKTERCPSG